MIEVEAKIQMQNPSKYREKIKHLANLKFKEKKIDDYYTLESLKGYPQKSLRIRKHEKFYEINFKQRISYINGIHAKNEEEFRVTNLPHFLDLIKDFGFKQWLRKEKMSEIYEIRKIFHIEINYVKHLGWFLEIERLCYSKKQVANARQNILQIIKKLNIDKKDIVKEGYTKMLWDKKKLGV